MLRQSQPQGKVPESDSRIRRGYGPVMLKPFARAATGPGHIEGETGQRNFPVQRLGRQEWKESHGEGGRSVKDFGKNAVSKILARLRRGPEQAGQAPAGIEQRIMATGYSVQASLDRVTVMVSPGWSGGTPPLGVGYVGMGLLAPRERGYSDALGVALQVRRVSPA